MKHYLRLKSFLPRFKIQPKPLFELYYLSMDNLLLISDYVQTNKCFSFPQEIFFNLQNKTSLDLQHKSCECGGHIESRSTSETDHDISSLGFQSGGLVIVCCLIPHSMSQKYK